ncbi:R3H domain protein, putative [Talaromyces stipitatus ATCC 10500]|uniref:R3H domain protein, putative n=1 Tax=Talaromyces stipitatus (strain ATCC 10500 / CBS 375.48 / QM 6759 / NRRL 1006) TaxID=441959 RepID=B8LVF5_TALSN|nr:R3H domain protein, putative [Talaromyces stipitatus ATCC 10500]EED23974.1 R3H domain protein, putative [Talaromyces stipitatus ATCC 10500]
MASQASGSNLNRPSFAKVVAMPALAKSQNPSVNPDEPEHQMNTDFENPQVTPASQPDLEEQHNAPLDDYIQGIEDGVERLSMNEKHELEFSQPSSEGLQREASFDDDQTHLSNSSTKPTSFDSKSMASVTTFAMDEKDSLRPDDSASVQAADEDDSLSGPASGAPNSLTSSEAGGRVYRDNLKDGILQRQRGVLPMPIQRFPDGDIGITGAIPPDSVANNFIISNQPDFVPGKSLNGYALDPDEKLLEAMGTPKDRLFILQLEEMIRDFIQDSKEQSLELPPSNAFGRLLAHKLGDYYHLTHFVDNNVTSVRLHRTPFCRLPTPLSVLRPVESHNTPPPNAPAMKIMRRNEISGDRNLAGENGTSSSGPSKPVSEAGVDGGNEEDRGGSSAGATPAKDRSTMTREEREAKYQEARERIFRDFPESKSVDSSGGDNSANISRSSSTSGRKKNFRQKTPHDDSFEARSQFNAYYPGMSYAANTASVPMNNGTAYGQSPYMVSPNASSPNMNYPQGTPTANVYQNNVSQYQMNTTPMGQTHTWQGPAASQQSPYQGYTALNQPPTMMGQQAQSGPIPAMNNYAVPNPAATYAPNASTPWTGQPYQNNYPQSVQRNAHWPSYPSHPMGNNTNPYSYGQQMPNQHYSTPQNQNAHQMMGNFNRTMFNPQTRSFVPTGNPTAGRYNPKGVNNAGGVAYNNPQSNMQRQKWSGQGHMESSSQSMAYVPPHPNNRANGNATSPSSMPRATQPLTNDSITKWGTPAHLPPKPPPSEVPSGLDNKSRNLPASSTTSFPNNATSPHTQAGGGPLVISGSGNNNIPKSSPD